MQPLEVSSEVESTVISLAANWAKEWADSDLPLTNVANIDRWEEAFSLQFSSYYATILRSVVKAREESQKNRRT